MLIHFDCNKRRELAEQELLKSKSTSNTTNKHILEVFLKDIERLEINNVEVNTFPYLFSCFFLLDYQLLPN